MKLIKVSDLEINQYQIADPERSEYKMADLEGSEYKMADLERSVSVGVHGSISQYDVPVYQILSSYFGGHISLLVWANHEKHLK